MHLINSLDDNTTFSPCQRSAFWSLTFVNIFSSTHYLSWAALYVWCCWRLFINRLYLLVFFTLCANKDLRRGLKLCLSLSCLALQSLQPELRLRWQSTEPLTSSINGENTPLVGDLQHLHRKCWITLDLCSKTESCQASVLSAIRNMKLIGLVDRGYQPYCECLSAYFWTDR